MKYRVQTPAGETVIVADEASIQRFLQDGTILSFVILGDDPDITPEPLTAYDVNLTPRQFAWMNGKFGYDDAIDAVLAATKTADRETYADIYADIEGATSYRFEVVLEVVGNPAVAPVIPEGVDVSEATLSERWMLAKDY